MILSALAHYYQDRFRAFVWLAVGYSIPTATLWDQKIVDDIKARGGGDVYAYQKFFCAPDGAAICDRNVSLDYF